MAEINVEDIIREYINRTIHMSLGTSKDNKPWVCEVHFVYDEDLNLYFRSLLSRRHSQEIALNPSVAGNIVRQHDKGEAPEGIYFEGQAARLTDDNDKSKAYPYFKERFGLDESILEEAKDDKGHQFYKIDISDWYAFGKFDQDSTAKHHLPWHKSSTSQI